MRFKSFSLLLLAMFSPISLISAIGIIQGVFILSLLVFKKHKTPTTKWAILLFVVFIVDLTWYFLYQQGALKSLWFLYGLEYMVLYLYGPTIYFYVRSYFEKEDVFFKNPFSAFHFLPALLVFILMSSLFFREQAIAFLVGLNLNDYFLFSTYSVQAIVFGFALWYLHITLYLIVTVRFLNKQEKVLYVHDDASKKERVRFVKLLLVGYLSFPLITLFLFLVNPFVKDLFITTYDMANILLVFHIFAISNIGYTNQDVITKPIKLLKRQSTNLANIDRQAIEERLQEQLGENKSYLDHSLTLSKLAKKMGVTTHQLSEYLNRGKEITFNDCVNHFRLEHAKKLLLDNEGTIYTMEGIAAKSGFKSLTTFHRNFKKSNGVTPSQWIKESKSR